MPSCSFNCKWRRGRADCLAVSHHTSMRGKSNAILLGAWTFVVRTRLRNCSKMRRSTVRKKTARTIKNPKTETPSSTALEDSNCCIAYCFSNALQAYALGDSAHFFHDWEQRAIWRTSSWYLPMRIVLCVVVTTSLPDIDQPWERLREERENEPKCY